MNSNDRNMLARSMARGRRKKGGGLLLPAVIVFILIVVTGIILLVATLNKNRKDELSVIPASSAEGSGSVPSATPAATIKPRKYGSAVQPPPSKSAEAPVPPTADPDYYSQQAVSLRIEALREDFPEGAYWNHAGIELEEGADNSFTVTDTPCQHELYLDDDCNVYDGITLELFPDFEYLTQCLGFASLVGDIVFGENAQTEIYYDYSRLRIGDHIRVIEDMHSMIVREIHDEYVTVLEVDADLNTCEISWSREISFASLTELGDDVEYLTRYP